MDARVRKGERPGVATDLFGRSLIDGLVTDIRGVPSM
jgi:hypothetical protein